MKKILFILLVLLCSMVIVGCNSENIDGVGPSGCPGRELATSEYLYKTSIPLGDCVSIEINPDCFPDSEHSLFVSNLKCNDNIIISRDQDGAKLYYDSLIIDLNNHQYVLNLSIDDEGNYYERSFLKIDNISQNIGDSWNASFYFENSPEEVIILKAKLYEINKYRDLSNKRRDYCHEYKNYESGTEDYFDCISSEKRKLLFN